MVKLHCKKKKKIVGSFNGISTTCKLEMDFFFSQLRNKHCQKPCKSCLRKAIKFKQPICVTRDMSFVGESRCGLSKFHCRNDVTQEHKVQAIKL